MTLEERRGILLPNPLSQSFMIKYTLSPLLLFLPTGGKCFSKALTHLGFEYYQAVFSVECKLLTSIKWYGSRVYVLPLYCPSLISLLFADVKQKLDKVTVLMMRLEVARLTVSWLLENLISSGPPLPLV